MESGRGLLLGRWAMNRNVVDKPERTEIMTPEEVACYLKKSLSWVYKHRQILGGVKLGGSILFSSKEKIHCPRCFMRLFILYGRNVARMNGCFSTPNRHQVHASPKAHAPHMQTGWCAPIWVSYNAALCGQLPS